MMDVFIKPSWGNSNYKSESSSDSDLSEIENMKVN